MTEALILPMAAIASTFFTWVLLRYAIARHVMDVPNARSSHSSVTPRGGGMAIVLVFLGFLFVLQKIAIVPGSLFLALAGSGLIVALIGFFDDHRPLPAALRLLAHFLAAFWAMFWISASLQNAVGDTILSLIFANTIATLYAVWLTNLYNFMDGIDGIAGIEASTVSLAATILYWLVLPSNDWLLPALLAACAVGFLAWNFPPARIFMGDSGSGFLGITFAVLSLYSLSYGSRFFYAWLILLGVFVVDATLTLARRAIRGEALHHAHSSHAYQHAARRLGSHRPVSLAVGLINITWLFPIAALVVTEQLGSIAGFLIAYVPLALLCLAYKGGTRQRD